MKLADFKRLPIGTKIRGGYIFRTGGKLEGLPWREITAKQSNGMKLDGSWLDYPKANASEYDGKFLKIYETGWRELTDEEKAVMAEWQKIADTEEYKNRAEIDILTDGSSTYWQERGFYERHNMLYLFENTPTKYLDRNKYNKGEKYCLRDNKAQHGELIAIYEILK